MFLSLTRKAAVVALAVAGAGIVAAAPASAAQQCGDLSGPSGGSVTLCKSWTWDGNDYDGKWWTDGPSSLPSYTYLQRSEDGHVTTSAYSGSYHDVTKLAFRLCDSLAGRCNGWW